MLVGGRNTKLCKRFDLAGDAHELTFSCYRNQRFLASERACLWLAESIEAAKDSCGFDLRAYVFMPTHVHMVICPRGVDYSVSAILKAIKTPVAVRAISYLKGANPSGLSRLATGQKERTYRFWQKGGEYDRNITDVDTLIKAIRYIYANPVRKKLVEDPAVWRYSSASEWNSGKPGILRIDTERWPVT